MTKYREILRLTLWDYHSETLFKASVFRRKTVVKVQKRAREMHLSWPLDENLTDAALETLMFPKESKISNKNGCQISTTSRRSCSATVSTKKLLWDGVPGGMPPVRRRAAHVFPVLLLHPAG